MTERIERIIQPGMPVEEARLLLERYGFRCRYDDVIGVPHLYGVQVKERRIWPFRATWSTTIYHQYGLVTGVKGHYEPVILERGIKVPPMFPGRFAAAAPKPGGKQVPDMVHKDTKSKTNAKQVKHTTNGRKKPVHDPRDDTPHP